MKALTLTQPWATLVAIGAKRIETRSWSASYRGVLAIHAAQGFPRACQRLCLEEPFLTAVAPHVLIDAGKELPRGAIVAIAKLVAVERTDTILGWNAVCGSKFLPQERAFGNYESGRFGFVLAAVLALPRPVPCKGALGLWTVPSDVVIRLALSVARDIAREGP